MRLLSLVCVFLLCSTAPAFAQDSELDKQEIQNQTWGAGRLVKGKVAGGKVAFTFDDGPEPETTPLILDALEATNRTEAAVLARDLGLKAPGEE